MTDVLPQAGWTRRESLQHLVVALGAGNMRYVGGAVRDTLLGLPVRDVDCATTLLPDQVVEACAAAGIRTVPTGIEHGTVTAILPDGPVEVTTLRRDVSTDGRRATVAFAEDWREDASRRDFTLNALYAHPQTLELADYFGGLEDLRGRRVRFIGDARQRIREDHLRILRYFRFQARFGDAPDEEALAACRDLAATLKGLSRERVAAELLALFALPEPQDTVALMLTQGVLPVILPEAGRRQVEALSALVRWERDQDAYPDPIRRLAALLPAVTEIAENVAARLRLSKAQRARLVCAAARTEADRARPRALAYQEGMECARDRLLLLGAPVTELDDWPVPNFPLKGRDVIAAGIEPGPLVARTLRAIENEWVAEGFPGRERAEEMLRNTVRGS